MNERRDLLSLVVLLVAACAALSGCASSPTQSRAQQWIAADEAEKQRLESSGFPQYIGE
ncbi:MAG TPA: hypothetical protein VLD36_11850 [Burkholderiales bacterium]|nr:hypothetical protein [Burkholderiales bacterium]